MVKLTQASSQTCAGPVVLNFTARLLTDVFLVSLMDRGVCPIARINHLARCPEKPLLWGKGHSFPPCPKFRMTGKRRG